MMGGTRSSRRAVRHGALRVTFRAWLTDLVFGNQHQRRGIGLAEAAHRRSFFVRDSLEMFPHEFRSIGMDDGVDACRQTRDKGQ